MTPSDNQDEPNLRRPSAPEDETRPAAGQDAGGRLFDDLARLGQQGSGPLPPSGTFPGYEILRELSHGGQGVVYQAIQTATKQKVALKVLLEGPYASSSARKRFEREIELVAQLRHPNIVSVFHAGQTTDGRQFYAMEYVRGTPLVTYVREKKLPLEEALRLFAKACEAIQHAHQRGIIHRDLKPSNILVDSAGEPKILDFGLAKWLAAPPGTAMTVSQQVMGTLPYMSPEQARGSGDEIDTRADIYALGVILYELLTGDYPYPVAGQVGAVLRSIAEEEPTPASRKWKPDFGIGHRATGRPRSRRCPIDDEVETIVHKALAKERERRYQSAGELARDIGHYLAGEPIEARRDSAFYVLRQQLRKHKGPVAAAAMLILLLTAWAVSMSVLAAQKAELARSAEVAKAEVLAQRDRALLAEQQAHRERERANVKAAEAERSRDQAERAREEALRALQRATESETQARQQRDLALQEKKAAEEARQQASARAREAEEQRDRAARLAQQLDERNQALDAERVRAEENARAAREEADRAATVRDFVESAMVFANADRQANRRAFAAALQTAAEFNARRLQQQPALEVAVRNLLARTYGALNNHDEEKRHAERALALAREHLTSSHPETIAALCNMATVLRDRGRYCEAESLIREAHASAESGNLLATNPDRLRADLLYAALVKEQGRPEEARMLSTRVLDACRGSLGMRSLEALAALQLGIVARDAIGNMDPLTEFDIKNARNISRALLGEDDRLSICLTLMATLMPVVGDLGAREPVSQQRQLEIEETTRQTFARAKRALGWDDPVTLMAAGGHMAALYLRGRPLQALVVLAEIPWDIGERLARRKDPEAVEVLSTGGYVLLMAGEYLGADLRQKGLRWQGDAIRLADEHLPPWHVARIKSRETHAKALAEIVDHAKGCEVLREAASIADANHRRTDYVRVLGAMAEDGCWREAPTQAERLLAQALEHLDEVDPGKRDELQLPLRTHLGACYAGGGRADEAEREYRLAVEAADRLGRHDKRVSTRVRLSSFYLSQHRCADARSQLQSALEIAASGEDQVQVRDIQERLDALAVECADDPGVEAPQ